MRDSGQPDWRCGEVAWQFQFPDAMLDRPVRELSGGWQTRVKLAALLLHEPNLLILDEPTNFLDLRTQMLLEHFLQRLPRRLPDRLARPRVPEDDLHAHARAVARQAHDVSRQRRRLPGQRRGAPRARPARERHDADQAAAAGNVHRQEPRQGQHGQPGQEQGQAARAAGADPHRRPGVDRAVPLSGDRAAARARPCARSIWRSAIRTTRSPATCTWRSTTARASASSATTARARRRSCGRCAARCRRSPAK